MQETARTLESLGASCIAIPCVTSHALYGELAAAVAVPILHMVEETAAYLKRAGIHKAGILATDGTVRTRLFQDALARHGITWAVPDEAGQRRVMELIYGQVKAGLPADPACSRRRLQPLRKRARLCYPRLYRAVPAQAGSRPGGGRSRHSRGPGCGRTAGLRRARKAALPICSRRGRPGGANRRLILPERGAARCAALLVF